MARTPSPHPTDVELEILQTLWDAGPSSLGQICTALRQQRPLATTTVATMLTVMLDKRLVRRKKAAAGYLWSAAVSRGDAAAGMIGKLLDRVFDGSASRLVAHLVEEGKMSPAELKEIRELLDEQSVNRGTRKPRKP